jgi:hypothetical protein
VTRGEDCHARTGLAPKIRFAKRSFRGIQRPRGFHRSCAKITRPGPAGAEKRQRDQDGQSNHKLARAVMHGVTLSDCYNQTSAGESAYFWSCVRILDVRRQGIPRGSLQNLFRPVRRIPAIQRLMHNSFTISSFCFGENREGDVRAVSLVSCLLTFPSRVYTHC